MSNSFFIRIGIILVIVVIFLIAYFTSKSVKKKSDKKVFNPIEQFFIDIGNFFKDFGNGNFKQGNIAFWLGIIGQIYNRVFELDGSLDKKWLLFAPLFYLPPFSAVPAYYFHFRKIKKGSGKKPIDKWMYIIFFSSIFYSIIFRLFGCDLHTPLVVISQILTFTIARLVTNLKICKGSSNPDPSVSRPLQMSIIAAVLAVITDIGIIMITSLLMTTDSSNLFFGSLKFIYGLLFLPFGLIGYIPGASVGLIMAFINIYLNMLNNDEEERATTQRK